MNDKLTAEDAITVLRNLQDWLYYSSMNGGTSIQREAIDMAIEALEEPKIIRCKDCDYYIVHRKRGVVPVCGLLKGTPIRHDDDFCSRAERREVTE